MRRLGNLFDSRRIRALRSRGFDRPQCVLFLTHKWTPEIAARHARLSSDLHGFADVFILHDSACRDIPRGIENAFAFNARMLERSLGYSSFTRGCIVPGSGHFPLLWFARRHACQHYWQIEYDVEFTGDWRTLLGAFEHSPADLVTAHIRRLSDTADWVYWPTFHQPAGKAVPEENLTRAFLPIFRLSAAGVSAVHEFHATGYRGHAEMLVPTCLSLRGLRIEDLNVANRFYAGSEQDPVFDLEQLSTLRWRPAVEMASEFYRSENLIYHPVK